MKTPRTKAPLGERVAFVSTTGANRVGDTHGQVRACVATGRVQR